MKMVLIMVNECGEEVEVETFNLGDDLDEDYIELWKNMKRSYYEEQYPEARGFYFENRSKWNSAIHLMLNNPGLEFEDAMYYV